MGKKASYKEYNTLFVMFKPKHKATTFEDTYWLKPGTVTE
jgi:hypothetical protein